MTDRTLTIAPQYNGPPRCGQGGYVSGSLALCLSKTEPVSARLHLPTPLGTPLHVKTSHDEALLMAEDKLLVTASLAAPLNHIVPPPCPPHDAVVKASALYRGHEDGALFTTCFVCGAARKDCDGMHVFAGPLDPQTKDEIGVVASHWTPALKHCDKNGMVFPQMIWAALDCPGFFAGYPKGKLALLAQFTCEIIKPLNGKDRATIVGWPINIDGRKSKVGTALYDQSGDLVAKTEGLWVEVNTLPF